MTTTPSTPSCVSRPFLNGYEKFLLNVLTAINVLIGIGFFPVAIIRCREIILTSPVYWADFMVYYSAAHMVRQVPALLYDYPTYIDFYHSLKPGVSFAFLSKAWYGYLAPPSLAVLLLPFTYLSFANAFVVWAIMNLCFCAMLAYATGMLAAQWKLEELKFFLGSCALGVWVTVNIISKGQFTLLMCLLLTYCLIYLRRNKPVNCALCLTLLLQLKYPLFIPLLFYIAGCRQWRIVQWTIVFSCIFIAATLPFLKSPAVWLDYLNVTRLFSAEHGHSDIYIGMINLRGICHEIFGEASGVFLTRITNIIFLLFCIACFLVPWIQRKQLDAAGAAAISALALFLSPYAQVHDALLLLPICVVTSALLRPYGKISFMFICYIFASYGTYPAHWFMRLILLVLAIAAVYLAWQKHVGNVQR